MKRVIGLQLSNCKEAERIRKGNKNLSGQGGEEGGEGGEGETKVQNLPKAFGELKINSDPEQRIAF